MHIICIYLYIKQYFYFIKQQFPWYKNELEQRRFEKAQRKRALGKGPPKKGSGKRASKKK